MNSANKVNLCLGRRIEAVRAVADADVTGEPGGHGDAIGDRIEALEAQGRELQAAIDALRQGAAGLVDCRREMIVELEGQLLQLSLGIAAKVLMQEIQAGRYEIDPIVKEALCHVSPGLDVAIRLNPSDYAQCELARQIDYPATGGQVRFVADPAVGRAECIVETSEGVIESSSEKHLAKVAKVLNLKE